MAVKRSRNNIIFQDDITQGLPSNPSSIAPLNAKIVFKDYEKYIKNWDMINPVRNGEFRGSFLYVGPDPRQLCVGPHKINKFIMLCRKKNDLFHS